MELTAEKFRKIVDVANPETPARTEREQRRTPRVRIAVRAGLMPFSDRFALQTIVAPVRDISRGGFGFLHDREVPLGEQFALLLPEESGRPMAILCTVTYYQPLAADLFAVGARFCRVLKAGATDLPLIYENAVSGERTEVRIAS